MAECELINDCPFFQDKLADMPSTANMLKNKFCKKDYENCARFMVFKEKGRPGVPADLFPNHGDRAKQIIG